MILNWNDNIIPLFTLTKHFFIMKYSLLELKRKIYCFLKDNVLFGIFVMVKYIHSLVLKSEFSCFTLKSAFPRFTLKSPFPRLLQLMTLLLQIPPNRCTLDSQSFYSCREALVNQNAYKRAFKTLCCGWPGLWQA